MSVTSTSNVDALKQLGLYRETESRGPTAELGQDAFLELMIAQMRNQDPMSPMENGEFIAQLAQFSTVTGVQKLQNSFDSFVNSMQSNQALQAASMVGRSVSVASPLGRLSDTGLDGEVELPATTGQLVVGIFDAAGQLVRRMPMGAYSAGIVPFHWDGKDDGGKVLPSGTYEVVAEALIEGKATAVGTNVFATVESVSLDRSGRGMQLNLTGIGSVSFSEVKQIK